LLPPTARAWEHFTLGGQCWCPCASVLPPSYASCILSSSRFWSMEWRSWARVRIWCLRLGGSRPTPRFAALLLSACHLACDVRALFGEPGWTHRACVPPEVLLYLCQVLASERVCDVAHLRYSECLLTVSLQPHSHASRHFRAAARVAMASEHPWLRCGLRSSQQFPDPLLLATFANRCLQGRVGMEGGGRESWKCGLPNSGRVERQTEKQR
jgi:hypothetical protein